MDLPSYIDEIGIAKAADQFDVAHRTVYSWKARERFPGRKKAAEIERRTKRKVTVAEIYAVTPQ